MEQRFVSKLDKISSPKGCWLWTACKNKGGYGVFRLNKKTYLAHRVAFEMWKNAISDRLDTRHKCDEPSCCNPEHLETGTRIENMNDMKERNRQKYGERHWRAKLTEDDVREIKIMLGFGIMSTELAKRFKISPAGIGDIKTGKNWKHI